MASVAERFEQTAPAFEEPIPLRPQTEKAGAYPVEALGPTLAEAARGIMDIVRVPDGIAAQSVLAGASLALQGLIDVRLPTGDVMPTSLFMVTVAASGDRKSAADRKALGAVYEYEETLRQRYNAACADHQNELTAHRAAASKAKTGKTNPLEIKEALEKLGAEPATPTKPNIVVTAPTAQGLQKLYVDARPSLGLFSDEGGAFLGGFSMSEDNRLATSTILSEFWDGKPIKKFTAGEAHIFLPGRRLAFHLMVQPGVSLKLFGVPEFKDQGFMSRILPSAPTSIVGTRFKAGHQTKQESFDALDTYSARMTELLHRPLPMPRADQNDMALEPAVVKFDQIASDAWWAFHDDVERKIGPGGEWESIRGFAAKLPEHAARLAAVVTNFHTATGRLTVEDVARGIALAEFYASEMLRLTDASSVPDEMAAADQLREWLVTKWKRRHIGLRIIMQSVTPASLRAIGAKRMRELCATLVDTKHLVPMPRGADIDGKHCKEAWTVVGVSE